MRFLTYFVFSVFLYQGKASVSENFQNCATLYSESGFNHIQGLNVSFKDRSRYADLRQEYFLDSTNPWSTTGSFSVESGCKLTGCNQSYFQGKCQEFDQSVNNLNNFGFETFYSVKCTCQRECSCADIRLRKTSCAYVFLGDGCDSCDPSYVEMRGSKNTFPKLLSNQLGAIKVKDGCTITVYDAEDFEGNSTLIQSGTTTKNFTESIKSHECSCSHKTPEVNDEPRNATYPPLIDIPQDVDGLHTLINGNNNGHPGLLAALKSVKHKRSSRNAYILVLGLTGSGKSTAINVLFDNPNITLVGGIKSTTSDIHEFHIQVPVDELGIQNSELRVIDTPGLSDTRGLQEDAKFLATLDNYLNTHEELHNRIPNVVLIFHKFSDNRFSGEGSRFVKMLRGLDSFRGRLIDENYSNVIFVLTHFCSVLSKITTNPEERLQEFRRVIEEYSVFPKPISIVVAEQKASEYDLPMIHGNFELPNSELYPQNLMQKISLLTSKGQDPIGQAVIHTAFNDFVHHKEYNISSLTHKLIENNNTTVPVYLNLLIGAEFNVDNTEVSQLLATAYNSTMEKTLKDNYPGCLPYLQKALNIRNIRNISDVPKTTLGTLEILSSINTNEAILHLLDKALSIKPVAFSQPFITGEFQGTPIFTSPFQSNSFITSEIGYTFPSFVTFKAVNDVKDNFKTFKTPQEYLEFRRAAVGIKLTDPVYPVIPSFSQGGFNILSTVSTTACIKLSAVREYRTFKLILNDNVPLSTEFSNALKALPEFDETDLKNIPIWRNFFVKYGTFVVQSVYGGGSIEIQVNATNAKMVTSISKSIFDFIDFPDKVELSGGKSRLDLSSIEYKLIFKGGDPIFHRSNFKNMSIENASNLLNNWKKSLTLRPVFLMTDLKLLPLSELAKTVGQNISAQVHDVTIRLLNSNLKYNPSQRVVVDLESCRKQLIESAKSVSNQTAVLVNEIKKMNDKIKEFQLKTKVDTEKAEKEIRDLNSEKSRLTSQVAEKVNAVKDRQKCEAHKMTSYKYS